ncbi:HAD-IIB family hydrolase [Reinekea marinisedimentorum]|uniref:Mannosyl-3-phosphoglycerate phosphatase n=1 Tax=Reinekea marinisedimentorum TaxID=230495 RepID=A0A4R3I5D9_9GAMM|nr:HAD-IIB family hydrolase [Reinekea marinisedimentorum]TCS39995.1 mannosyl-3-phosphoglycerate phosphatase [Reinekea marinisedimentorum]
MSYVVYTDLDGTLLDHDNYSYQAALPALERLNESGIPVVPVTSKTRAEIEPLCHELKLNAPFIVENGAAIFIPKVFCTEEACSELPQVDGYRVKSFAPAIDFWNALVVELEKALSGAFVAMNQMSAQQLADMTSLSLPAAERALKREYSNPLQWLGSDEQLQTLSDICAQKGVQVVKGGRFVHLLKNSDKGAALVWLNNYLSEFLEVSDLESIALGDGENDIAMQLKADIAVQIRSPAHEFPELEKTSLYRTEKYGPEGWAEAITKILNSSPKESK